MWMVATQDTLDPGVGGVVRQECQGDTASSLRRLNGRNDACVRLRKICNGKRPQTSGRIDWNARARGPEHRQEADPSMLAGRRVSAISPPLFQLGGCLLTSYPYPIHFHTAGRHRMILGAAARGDGSTGSLCSEPFFGVPTPDGGRPPLHCALLHASPIVDVASRSAADRGMQSSLQRFEAC